MSGFAVLVSPSSPPPATRRAPTLHGAIGLLGDPFPLAPATGAYVPVARQTAVLAGLRAWLSSPGDESLGLAVIAGPAGSGKTRLLEQLVLGIAGDDRLIGVMPAEGTRRTDAHLLRSAIVALGGTPAGRTGLELTTELRAILNAHREDPLPPVLLLDAAELTGPQLEILRGVLTNPAPVPEPTRVQIVLFGPPALPDRIARRQSLAELTRSVAAIPPLELSEAGTLLNGRIEAVRDPDAPRSILIDPFVSERALDILLEVSEGNPGALLALAHAAVREVIATGRRQVDAVTALTVASEAPGATSPARAGATGDPAIQTRLALPGVDEADASAPARRRQQQP